MSSAIQAALPTFQTLPLKDAARQLLAKLGYQSDKFLVGAGSKPQDFLADFASGHPFDPAKALVPEWKSADLLFQLTDQELSRESSLFTDDSVQRGLLKSYIFIAIELKGSDYARGKFSAIARQINRLFPMPVMVLFKHADRLTVAVINRRRHKLDDNKDVLEKATLIRDISLANPHRGHLDILASLALPNLVHPQKLPITDFDTLHAAWEQIFNVELLNERFYRELANWYFWALPQVEFPADLEPDDEKRRATGLIRLLTRLIFCWFLKEKGLVPEKLFHPADLAKILKGFDPESETSSTYYQAILQNLFFATLNQRMGKDGNGKPYRVFATDEGFAKNRATYDINNLFRYEKLFAVPQDDALALFADIPFLNGGLFECLDRTEDGTDKKRYLDGFSRNPKKRPHVPDRLFFDSGETADLSEVYGDKKRKSERVTGLISILNRYKFTIVENTPIDQEIALDPELLGKVFENLLASYNEETKTTARKQTGSFYTPRPIVDYMVDESLKAHLHQKVEQTFLSASSSQDIAKTHRDLPHWKKDGAIYWITFRMADSLPQEKLRAWKMECEAWRKNYPEPWDEATWKEYNERFGEKLEAWLDAGMGSRALARPEVREAVKSCLMKFDGERLLVHAAVIMPNHVHALIEPIAGHDLSKLLQGIKGASAREANKILGATGSTFWLDESYDHIVRSEAQYRHFVRYIAENPEKARLSPGEFWLKKGHIEGGADIPVCISPTTRQTGMSAPLSQKLDLLFAYTEKEHAFTPAEVATLITAIDEVKILDPACGSGAFPMGVLHKLVYILGKLDPDNQRWKQTQLAKLDSAPMREELERAFADNNDDYGRKLYLIENCLYGVDIQPIAIQITKLRFFISLVCDQKTNRSKKDNHGIRPLPNLETKFVAANTLIGLPIPEPDLFLKSLIEPIEKEIETAYHGHFTIQRRDQKLALQKKIKTLRQKLTDTLLDGLGANKGSEVAKKAQHLADWDPFDPQSRADFFDPHWMFGRSLSEGFDVVIGNPPYVFGGNIGISAKDKQQFKNLYVSGAGKTNLFVIFIERGAQLLRRNGLLSYILPNTLLRVTSYDATRRLVLTQYRIEEILDLDIGVFDQVTASTIAIRIRASMPDSAWMTMIRHGLEDKSEKRCKQSDWLTKGGIIDIFSTQRDREILDLIETGSRPLGDLCHRIRFGVVISGNLSDVVSSERHGSLWKPFLEGDEIGPYSINYRGRFLNYDASLLHRSRTPDVFECRKIMIQRITGGQTPLKAALDDNWFYNKESILNLILNGPHTGMYGFILALINSKTANWFYRKRFTNDSKLTVNLSKEYVGQIPVKTPAPDKLVMFEHLVRLLMHAKRKDQLAASQFLEDLIDACVMECYFREHMAERDLLFHDLVAPHLAAYDPAASEAQQRDFLTQLHQTLNAPSHPIRNRLLRLTADSPDLLAIIKQEGKV